MMRPYQQAGLRLQRDAPADPELVRALQLDLRSLGYLKYGINGTFGAGTDAGVRALQYDLLHNDGQGSDGRAPVAPQSFNQDAHGPVVSTVDGVVDQRLAGCIAAMLADDRFTKLPDAADPAAENRRALAGVAAATTTDSPAPFIAAMVLQESSGMHFQVPNARDRDNFIVVGLDHNAAASASFAITSRGYGIGQYTLFHHPAQPAEIQDFMLDPVRNVSKAHAELADKFKRFTAGPADTADDRKAEHPLLPLRSCRYPAADPRYMRDCARCARAVGTVSIQPGTPVFKGSQTVYEATQYYPGATYGNVPDRAQFLCDWPYAVRRYNGSGVNSYHYQTRVLLHLAAAAAPG